MSEGSGEWVVNLDFASLYPKAMKTIRLEKNDIRKLKIKKIINGSTR